MSVREHRCCSHSVAPRNQANTTFRGSNSSVPHNQAIAILVRLQSLNSCNAVGQTDIFELEIRVRIFGALVDTVSSVLNPVIDPSINRELDKQTSSGFKIICYEMSQIFAASCVYHADLFNELSLRKRQFHFYLRRNHAGQCIPNSDGKVLEILFECQIAFLDLRHAETNQMTASQRHDDVVNLVAGPWGHCPLVGVTHSPFSAPLRACATAARRLRRSFLRHSSTDRIRGIRACAASSRMRIFTPRRPDAD